MKNLYKTYIGLISLSTIHKSELISIQWMRGIAVLMVFIYHLEDIFVLLPEFSEFHSFWMLYGYSAPDLFFVVSGFIMCFVTFELKFSPLSWLARRIMRIYPIFIIFALVATVIWIYDPSMTMGSGVQTWSSVLKFFFLVPQEGMPLIFVAWTLEHEIVFYALVFIIATAKGKSKCVVVVTGILSCIAVFKSVFQDMYPVLNFWDYHIFSLYMVQFFLGALIFELRNHLSKIGVLCPLLVGVIMFILSGLICEPAPLNSENVLKIFMFGISFTLLIIGAINWENKKRKEIGGYIEYKRRPFLVQMGDASYSIYLSHPFLLSILGKIVIATKLSGAMAIMALFFGGIIALFIGWCLYHLLEKPMIHLSKTILSKRKR